jgi:hypothetical protein
LPVVFDLFFKNTETYKFDGEAASGCGRPLVAALQASAFA